MSEHPNLLKSVLIFTNPKGQHNSSLAYQKMDEVQHQTSIYVATENIPAGVAITDARWAKKLDNSTAYQAEQERKTAEGEREQAEVDRETAEGLREQGEIDRGNAYSQAELARDGLYATAESARDDLFTGSQQDRTSAYNLRENQRDDAYAAAELIREGAETARETAEGLRDEAEGLRASSETSRNTAEGLRDGAETARREAEVLRIAAEAARMGFIPKGPYNPANENKHGEWYTHEGGSWGYIWPEPSTGVPLTDTTHWQQIAQKGDRVALTGPWNEATTYSYYQSAEFYGSSYIYINPTPSSGHTPLDTNYWMLWAARGEQFVDTTNLTWQGVRDVVRQGLGPKVFPVGSVLRTPHTTYGDILWRITAHNHDINVDAPGSPTMRHSMITCIYNRQVDAPELLWANTSAAALPAGTYNFTFLKADRDGQTREDGTYQFTTAQPIPVGGGFRHSQAGLYRSSSELYVPANIIGNHLTTYDASGVAIESNLSVTAGSGGTALGTASRNWADTVNIIGRFNSTQRNAYGSNNDGESAVRQWLSSSLGANLWWVKKTPFDLKPTYADQPGFLAGFSADFLDALVTVENVCARNTIYEEGGTLGGSYITTDKMFRPSMTELGLGANNSIAEGAVLDYYDGSTAIDRIKFDIANPSTARYWWLRSPNPSHANHVRYINPDGALNNSNAHNGNGVAPDCVIG